MIESTIVEPTTALRDWLRTEALACGEAVYAGGLPQAVTLPALVITAVGGTVAEPVLEGTYQFDAWADTGPAAAALAGDLISLLYEIANGRVAAELHGYRFQPMPNPAPRRAREFRVRRLGIDSPSTRPRYSQAGTTLLQRSFPVAPVVCAALAGGEPAPGRLGSPEMRGWEPRHPSPKPRPDRRWRSRCRG